MFILMKCRMCDVWTLYYSKILSFQETSALLLKDCLISTSHGYTLMLTNIFIKNTLVSKVFWPNVNFVFSYILDIRRYVLVQIPFFQYLYTQCTILCMPLRLIFFHSYWVSCNISFVHFRQKDVCVNLPCRSVSLLIWLEYTPCLSLVIISFQDTR